LSISTAESQKDNNQKLDFGKIDGMKYIDGNNYRRYNDPTEFSNLWSLLLENASFTESSYISMQVQGEDGEIKFKYWDSPFYGPDFMLIFSINGENHTIPFTYSSKFKEAGPFPISGDSRLIWDYRAKNPNKMKNRDLVSSIRLDDIGLEEMQFIKSKKINCPILIHAHEDKQAIAEAVRKSCNTILLSSGVNLQEILDIIEKIQNEEGLANKTLLLDSGSYEGPINIKAKNLIIEPKSYQDVTIKGNNAEYTVCLNNTTNVQLFGLNLIDSSTGIILNSSMNCIISDNTIDYLDGVETGIYIFNSSDNIIRDNAINPNGADDITIASNRSKNNNIYVKNDGIICEGKSYYYVSGRSFLIYDLTNKKWIQSNIQGKLKLNNTWWLCQ
jgi:parallel beta-helix repeat protein